MDEEGLSDMYRTVRITDPCVGPHDNNDNWLGKATKASKKEL
jgi:hypothetical protein